MWANLVKSIIVASLDAIVCADEAGKIILWNRAAKAMFGYTEAEALGQPLSMLLREQDRAAHLEGFQRFLETGEGPLVGKITETVGLRRNGSTFPKEMSLAAEKVEGKWVFTAILRDISVRRQADNALRQRVAEAEGSRQAMLYMLEDLNEFSANIERIKQEWVQTFDAVSNPIFLHDADGNILRANRAYAEKADMAVEEVIGKPYWQVFPRSDKRLHSCEDAAVTGEAEEEISTDDGTVFLVHSYVMSGDGASRRSFIHWMEDITGRKKAEVAIRDSEERFRSVSEAAQDAIIMLDNEGKVDLWNPAAENILGFSQHEAMGKKIEQLVVPERFRKKHQHGYATFKGAGQGPVVGKTVELAALNKDGTEFPIELSISAAKAGGAWQAVGIMRDITERKQGEEALIQSHERLQRSLEGTIQAIAAAVEARDPYTAGHQRRVAALADAIAHAVGLEEKKVEGIHWGAMIHDIGKINLPAEILSKPSKLSEIEYSLIQGHPQVGYDILKDIEFPWPVADIAHQHHERMNGSGYPQGLKGDEICLEACIVAVADVVEAMASHRPYRASLGVDAALEEIKSKRGQYYDPDVADACLKVFADGFAWPVA